MKKKNSKEAADFPGRFGALTWRPGDLMKNLETPGKTGRVDRYDYSTFNLDEMTESECLSEFRFRKRAILADVLGIPETIRCEQGSTCDGLERY